MKIFLKNLKKEESVKFSSDKKKFVKKITKNAKLANQLGLKVAAGHGLNYQNINLITKIKNIEEYIEEGFVKSHMVATTSPEPPKTPVYKKIGSSFKSGFDNYMAKV